MAPASSRSDRRSIRAALRRLIRREKPTALVASDPGLREKLVRAARRDGPGVVLHAPAMPPAASPRELYPELPLFAPRAAWERVARLAIAVVLHSPVTHSTYAISSPPRPSPPRRITVRSPVTCSPPLAKVALRAPSPPSSSAWPLRPHRRSSRDWIRAGFLHLGVP